MLDLLNFYKIKERRSKIEDLESDLSHTSKSNLRELKKLISEIEKDIKQLSVFLAIYTKLFHEKYLKKYQLTFLHIQKSILDDIISCIYRLWDKNDGDKVSINKILKIFKKDKKLHKFIIERMQIYTLSENDKEFVEDFKKIKSRYLQGKIIEEIKNIRNKFIGHHLIDKNYEENIEKLRKEAENISDYTNLFNYIFEQQNKYSIKTTDIVTVGNKTIEAYNTLYRLINLSDCNYLDIGFLDREIDQFISDILK